MGGEVHRPETSPLVPFCFTAHQQFLIVFRKMEGINLSFKVSEDNALIKATVEPPS